MFTTKPQTSGSSSVLNVGEVLVCNFLQLGNEPKQSCGLQSLTGSSLIHATHLLQVS